MIIGTAGHIDHGKTALVRALTGIDTDRLPEEKRRGITIELGFAPLELDGIGRVGIVDVPGHEAFVRTMLAGATGVDLALLVVAADEGTMPQTTEHLAILSLLGVRGGVISVTKRDLVDEEWLALVCDDVRAEVAGTPLSGAAIVPTSVLSGEGLAELRNALRTAAREVPTRAADDLFRMPVDRVFTVRGTGTVVTGTIWSGSVAPDRNIRILPAGLSARVRGVQTHGRVVDEALPGTRTAIALAGVGLDRVERGSVLVSDDRWTATTAIRADVALLATAAAPLRARSRVRFHLGTSEVGARIVARTGFLEPGGRSSARIVLDEPIVARAGDRFVLRSATPLTTIGGGLVTDPLPPVRRPRSWSGDASTPASRMALLLQERGPNGVERETLPIRLGTTPAETEALLSSTEGKTLVTLGGRVFAAAAMQQSTAALLALVEEYHARCPLEPGAPLQSIRSRLPGAPELVDAVIRAKCAAGELVSEGGLLRRRDWAPQLTAAQVATREAIRASLEEAGREPPSVPELCVRHGPDAAPILRLLERDGSVVQVEEERFYSAAKLEQTVESLKGGMSPGREYSPAELRELLGVSRKYLIPLLEFCDRRGVTLRTEHGRSRGGT